MTPTHGSDVQQISNQLPTHLVEYKIIVPKQTNKINLLMYFFTFTVKDTSMYV